MNRRKRFMHQFVEYLPDTLEDGIVYVSIKFSTVAHRCFCGCGEEVVTPLSPTDWRLTFDGESISLDPSIGNWSLACRSHYWLTDNQVHWAAAWTKQQIERGRYLDRFQKREHFKRRDQPSGPAEATSDGSSSGNRSWVSRLLWWR